MSNLDDPSKRNMPIPLSFDKTEFAKMALLDEIRGMKKGGSFKPDYFSKLSDEESDNINADLYLDNAQET